MRKTITAKPTEPAPTAPMLAEVVERLSAKGDLSDTRQRDLRSAIVTYGKIVGQPIADIPLDLAAMRKTLDGIVPRQAKVSRKRWANLRSDIAAAIAASGIQPMLKTSDVKPNEDWEELLRSAKDRRIINGLSRLARWATLREVSPETVDGAVLERFSAELEANSLVRNLSFKRRNVAKLWNRLVVTCAERNLKAVDIPEKEVSWHRIPWQELPVSLRQETEDYMTWCTVPDPLDENARARALAPQTLRLRRHYIHLAATAACDAGIKATTLTSLSKLVEPETYRAILRQQWQQTGGKSSAHLLALANDLITVASEWVRVSPDQITELKKVRGKLGSLPHGLTEKNRSLLRRLEDPHLLDRLVKLPDQLWRQARRESSPRSFIDLQTALAIDLLLHVAPRIEDLGKLKFDEHIHWPQGRGKPALIVFRQSKVPNGDPQEFELPAYLSDRLYEFRNEIAASLIRRRPDVLFVSTTGKPRTMSTLRVAIQRTILRSLGLKITPHQFRHLLAQIHLNAYPGAHESVRQQLGHKELKTTTRFYAGPNTRRAGRLHAELIRKLREPKLQPRRHGEYRGSN